MTLKYKVLSIVSLILLFYSCAPLVPKPEEANMLCDDFYVQGQFKNDFYTFCGIEPRRIDYSYKIGSWQYWNLQGGLIAKGTYKSEKNILKGEGGCSYEIIQGIIDDKNWIFLDENGNQIKPNEELIEKLQACNPIKIKGL